MDTDGAASWSRLSMDAQTTPSQSFGTRAILGGRSSSDVQFRYTTGATRKSREARPQLVPIPKS